MKVLGLVMVKQRNPLTVLVLLAKLLSVMTMSSPLTFSKVIIVGSNRALALVLLLRLLTTVKIAGTVFLVAFGAAEALVPQFSLPGVLHNAVATVALVQVVAVLLLIKQVLLLELALLTFKWNGVFGTPQIWLGVFTTSLRTAMTQRLPIPTLTAEILQRGVYAQQLLTTTLLFTPAAVTEAV